VEPEAVTRIVDQVGSKYTPSNLDRQGLRHDLGWAGTWYGTRVSLRDEAKRDRRIEAALKAAKRFQQKLAKLEYGDLPQILEYLPKTDRLKEDSPFVKKLQRFIAQADAALKTPRDPGWAKDSVAQLAKELHLGERSPLEWLAGVELPKIFEKHFGRPARISRDKNGAVGGPFVRFAAAALKELKIQNKDKPFAAETIADALANARNNRSRRTWGKAT
jgi:hypothetical protein